MGRTQYIWMNRVGPNIYVLTYMHTYMHTCMHTSTQTHMHTYILTHMYTYIHTNTHAYIQTFNRTCRHLSKETYYSVKRDPLQCQKRPTTVSKETYYSVKRDLLHTNVQSHLQANKPARNKKTRFFGNIYRRISAVSLIDYLLSLSEYTRNAYTAKEIIGNIFFIKKN